MWYKLTWIYVWQDKVRPSGWKPWSNTVAYWTLNWDINDHSGNWHDMSARVGTISYWTLSNGYKYGIFDWNTIITTSNITTLSSGTILMYLDYIWYWTPLAWNTNTNNSNNYNYISSYWSSNFRPVYSPNKTTITATAPWQNQWFLFAITQTGSKLTYYKDGQFVSDYNNSLFINANPINQWCIWWLARWTQYYDRLDWYMSNIIIEDRVWTADEILKYFNQTKSNYWL